jgi:type IV pilus assembly protein PilB
LRSLTGLEIQVVATSAKDIRRMITTLPDSKVFVIDDIIDDTDQAEVTLIEEAIEDIGDARSSPASRRSSASSTTSSTTP